MNPKVEAIRLRTAEVVAQSVAVNRAADFITARRRRRLQRMAERGDPRLAEQFSVENDRPVTQRRTAKGGRLS